MAAAAAAALSCYSRGLFGPVSCGRKGSPDSDHRTIGAIDTRRPNTGRSATCVFCVWDRSGRAILLCRSPTPVRYSDIPTERVASSRSAAVLDRHGAQQSARSLEG
eukprot:COSAG02_NODE_4206_length_5626_cov_10.092619_8_plen_106_part_00